jgi:hypothetical protein
MRRDEPGNWGRKVPVHGDNSNPTRAAVAMFSSSRNGNGEGYRAKQLDLSNTKFGRKGHPDIRTRELVHIDDAICERLIY